MSKNRQDVTEMISRLGNLVAYGERVTTVILPSAEVRDLRDALESLDAENKRLKAQAPSP